MDRSELVGYIERSIVDIARKCGVQTSEVINTFKEKYAAGIGTTGE